MNGIILLNKKKGITSRTAIVEVSKALGIKKIGHAGTLDPLATGLLVILLNDATKLSDYLINEDKEYIAEILIGRSTSTLDSEGEIIEEKKVTSNLNIDEVLNSFVGTSNQTPPMYSAIKQKGKKLYELARAGVDVARESREITIYNISRVSDIVNNEGLVSFKIKTKVSKGTYIRVLAEDIGKRLGYPAHLAALERTASGAFKLIDANTIEEIKENNYNLIKMHEALSSYPLINVNEELAKLIMNGSKLNGDLVNSNEQLVCFIFNETLIGIYERKNDEYRVRRVWN